MVASALQLRLEAWSRGNAVALSCALVLGLWLGKPWPIGVVALGSFAMLVLQTRGEWTPAGHFGVANAVTSLRLSLMVALSSVLHGAAGSLIALLILATLGLDGLDGWLARRTGTSSIWGAHFDMEVDGLLVLTTSAELALSGRFGGWILTAGLLRYLYVLCVAQWPPRGGPMPRTLLGRSAFALVVVGHALGFALPAPAALLAAAFGTAAVTLSFARSFVYGYARPAKPLVDS